MLYDIYRLGDEPDPTYTHTDERLRTVEWVMDHPLYNEMRRRERQSMLDKIDVRSCFERLMDKLTLSGLDHSAKLSGYHPADIYPPKEHNKGHRLERLEDQLETIR
jgi:hypothetical protein